MKSKNIIFFGVYLLLFIGFVTWQISCGPSGPTTPLSNPGPTNTFTVTAITTSNSATPTATAITTPNSATPTATYSCSSAPDITANIDGADYVGDDRNHTLSSSIPLDQGGTSTGDVLQFTLTSPKTLNFSFCPSEDPDRVSALYVRPDCQTTANEAYNGGYCDGMPQIVGATFNTGTYYVILSEFANSEPSTQYSLRITSGSVPTSVCSPNNGAAPETIPTITYASCNNVYQLNGTAGQFGNPFSGIKAATGSLNDTLDPDDFISFTPANSGPVTVILDCFDNGLNNIDFDLYVATSCPTNGTSPPLAGFSNSTKPIETVVFTGVANTTYYLDVQAYLGSGAYHLSIQTP